MIPDSLKTSGELLRECTASCSDAYRCCMETVVHCIDVNGEHNEPVHLKAVLDCADLCAFTLQLLLRGSDHVPALCALCAEVCLQCADSCETFGEERMTACADTCRACARHCERIVREASMAGPQA
jgi:hypothetical protein